MCTKKPYDSKWEAKKVLFGILKRSSKNPWRDEISVYKCEECGQYHVSSKATDYVPTALKDKSYFNIQKEKWGEWLQNFSAKKGNINQKNKKYST